VKSALVDVEPSRRCSGHGHRQCRSYFDGTDGIAVCQCTGQCAYPATKSLAAVSLLSRRSVVDGSRRLLARCWCPTEAQPASSTTPLAALLMHHVHVASQRVSLQLMLMCPRQVCMSPWHPTAMTSSATVRDTVWPCGLSTCVAAVDVDVSAASVHVTGAPDRDDIVGDGQRHRVGTARVSHTVSGAM
jgi:hypothetical protein